MTIQGRFEENISRKVETESAKGALGGERLFVDLRRPVSKADCSDAGQGKASKDGIW